MTAPLAGWGVNISIDAQKFIPVVKVFNELQWPQVILTDLTRHCHMAGHIVGEKRTTGITFLPQL